MNIALIAHDSKRADGYSSVSLTAAFSAGTASAPPAPLANWSPGDRPSGVPLLSGGQGGGQQIAARIQCNEIDLLLFLQDPISTRSTDPEEANLLRLCDVHNIPAATNIATAEALIHALDRGDLDWRIL